MEDILHSLPKIIEDAERLWAQTFHADLSYEAVFDRYEGVKAKGDAGRLIMGDNLAVAKTLFACIRAGTQAPIDLIYMDPPFFTKTDYASILRIGERRIPLESFSDIWKGKEGFARYLTMIAARVIAARELLADTGCLWLHLDFHALHYVKILADHIFGGSKHLINEVVWQYKSGGSSTRRFARKHDTLLFYVKTPGAYCFTPMREKSYNRERRPYGFKGVREYRDEGGWYTLVNMRDVWRIDMVGRTSRERTGYVTQKPEELLSRIIAACTREGDLCADLFSGSGTLAAAAEDLRRQWIACDSNPFANLCAEKRMIGKGAAFDVLSQHELSPSAANFTVELAFGDTPDSHKKLASVRVLSYEMPQSALVPEEKYIAYIKEAEQTDPACLIGSIAVDFDWDGEIFRPQAVAYGRGHLETLIDADERLRTAADARKRIAVRIADVFGHASVRPLSKGDSLLL
jgi:DNA modification methylase